MRSEPLLAVAEFTDSRSKPDTGIRLITCSINETHHLHCQSPKEQGPMLMDGLTSIQR